jgi:hypothetical protein
MFIFFYLHLLYHHPFRHGDLFLSLFPYLGLNLCLYHLPYQNQN